ncbi:hypothetical protein ANANG_G00252020, partial [Anguilla anguilla]
KDRNKKNATQKRYRTPHCLANPKTGNACCLRVYFYQTEELFRKCTAQQQPYMDPGRSGTLSHSRNPEV